MADAPVTAYEFVKICQEAGLPDGLVNLVNGGGSLAGDLLAHHKGVDQTTFTGSVPTGERVLVAAASHTIPGNMELGVKSPQILFADADLDGSLPIIAGGFLTHCSQVCNAGTRLFIERSAHDKVVDKLHQRIAGMKLSAGVEDPDMGPLSPRRTERMSSATTTRPARKATCCSAPNFPSHRRLPTTPSSARASLSAPATRRVAGQISSARS